MSDKKPREYFIKTHCKTDNCSENYCHVFEKDTGECFKVIEYSAYDELKKENECLRKIAKDFQEVCAVGSPTWMAIEETLRENKEQL